MLSDGYLANRSEPWLLPDFSKMPPIIITHPDKPNSATGFQPYKRDANGSRPWAIPGTPGLEHRIGGLEKQDVTGTVSYDPANHDRMCRLRAAKIAGIKPPGAAYIWDGPPSGDLLLIGWGNTFGAIKAACIELRRRGVRVSACHLRYLQPLPAGLVDLFKGFKHLLLPELNLGQLLLVLRAHTLMDIKGFNKVRGQPFTIREIVEAAQAVLEGRDPSQVAPEEFATPSVADIASGG
jgi:2-oxoglutarate ferredoxin oxidoreductase subunit alpha